MDERLEKIAALRADIDAFTDEIFGEAELMPTDAYPTPPFDISKVSHPRLLINRDMIPTLRELLKKDAPSDEYSGMRELFWKYADEEGITGEFVEVGEPILYKNGTPDDPTDDYYLKDKFENPLEDYFAWCDREGIELDKENARNLFAKYTQAPSDAEIQEYENKIKDLPYYWS